MVEGLPGPSVWNGRVRIQVSTFFFGEKLDSVPDVDG